MSYKIKVNSEAENKEVQELFFELGRKWGFGKPEVKHTDKTFILMHGVSLMGYCSTQRFFDNHEAKEITLPQLRDIVVLKRNDVGDASHKLSTRNIYVDSSNQSYVWNGVNWAICSFNISSLKPIKKESGMLTNKEALMALANGEDVLYINTQLASSHIDWADANELTVSQIKSGGWAFKIKPKTILINGVEVPKPFEPKEGEEYWYIVNGGGGYRTSKLMNCKDVTFGKWRTESEIKQVVAALRKVFGGV